jgi:hydrogenase maturation protease
VAERVLVLGVGNPDRGDDGSGRVVARALRKAAPTGVTIDECDGETTAVLARLEGVGRAIIIDASAGGPPGRVRCFDVAAAPMPAAALRVSSHGLGLHEAIELARALGALPERCEVYAIAGGCFDIGAPLTPAVAAAADELAGRLAEQLGGPASKGGVHA